MKKLLILLNVTLLFLLSEISATNFIIGQAAPNITNVKLINGTSLDLNNKFVILDFWATWCKPCVKSLPYVNELAGKHKDKVAFIAISDEKEETIQAFLYKRNLDNLLFGLDIQSNLFIDFSIKDIPTYILISPDNTILAIGNSAGLKGAYLDSLITSYYKTAHNTTPKISFSTDSSESILSINISNMPGSKKLYREGEYSVIARDSLQYILRYLAGNHLAKRQKWAGTSKEMIEVKLFSRNIPVDSLKMVAHDMIMNSYGISKKEVSEQTNVFLFNIKNEKLLKDKNTIPIKPGVLNRRFLINDSTYRFNNYTINDLVAFLEGAYFPQIMYAKTPLTNQYDWDLPIVDTVSHTWVSFDKLKTILLYNYGVEIEECLKDETILIYH
jgi:thiol-disulfide isomerase/thioredoxin